MALSPKDQKHRDNLTKAAHALRETGKPDLAESVDYVLSPDGIAFIGRLRLDRFTTESEGTTIPVRLQEAERDQLHARAKAAGESLSKAAKEGLREFVSGSFTPAPKKRARRGSFGKTVNLNVKTDDALSEQADAKCKELQESGQRVFVSTVVYDWLCRRYKVGPYAEAESAS